MAEMFYYTSTLHMGGVRRPDPHQIVRGNGKASFNFSALISSVIAAFFPHFEPVPQRAFFPSAESVPPRPNPDQREREN